MKAFVLAAGLGTRLKPFTLTNPKALVPVGGVPMLERVLLRLRDEGFDEVVVNVHHFAEKIEAFLREKNNFGMRVEISSERDLLRDTGGAIRHARRLLGADNRPFLIHNVDILSDAPLRQLMEAHCQSGRDATLLVSGRESSRQLIFDEDMKLRGWHNLQSGEYKPSGYAPSGADSGYAFSGIHIMSPARIFEEMERQGRGDVFSVIDFYLEAARYRDIGGVAARELHLIDIGKPATLSQAESLFGK